jgi:hypothetical protein
MVTWLGSRASHVSRSGAAKTTAARARIAKAGIREEELDAQTRMIFRNLANAKHHSVLNQPHEIRQVTLAMTYFHSLLRCLAVSWIWMISGTEKQ